MKLRLLSLTTALLLSTSCQAEEVKKDEPLYSLPFIVIDLDKDGVDFIPLEESEAYFDVDGDGEKERTAWIKSEDVFLTASTKKEDRTITDKDTRLQTFLTGGFKEISQYDKNKDYMYNQEDAQQVLKDRYIYDLKLSYIETLSGNNPLGKSSYLQDFCMFKAINLPKEYETTLHITSEGKLVCEDETYPLYEVQFEYLEEKEN